MYRNKSILCLILARGGSKGVPGKNIKPLNGKPLIDYTVEAVQKAKCFDRIILSTDDDAISRAALRSGVEVPFKRPKHLAGDKSSALDAIVHALKWVEKNDKKYELVQYIYPTAPLRTAGDVAAGVDLLLDKKADMVISVCETDHPTFWANTLKKGQSLRNFIDKKYRWKNRQELPKTYRLNGAIIVGKWDIFAKKKDWFEMNTIAYVMPRERSIDIDTPVDFQLAELFLKEKIHG